MTRKLYPASSRLSELHVSGSCWADVVGLLVMVGHKLETLNLVSRNSVLAAKTLFSSDEKDNFIRPPRAFFSLSKLFF